MYCSRLRPLLLLALFGLSVLSAPPTRADDDVEVEGVIEALGDETLTVGGFTFLVTGATEIEGDDGDIGFEDLAVGQFVEVEGFYTADGTLVAEEIEVEDGGDDDGDEVEVEGLITALADDGLTVGGLFFLVTDATEIEGDDGDIAFEDLAVGQFVEVEGHYDASGDLIADEIEVEDDGDDDGDDSDIEVEGTIDALGASTVTVGSYTFLVTEGTEIEGEDDSDLTFADLAVGQFVEVEGAYGSDGTLFAIEIEVEDFDDDEIEVEGAIEALGDASITVLGLTFGVTDATIIRRDDDDEPILFTDLTVGLHVEVHGREESGTLIARRIEVDDDFDDDGEVEVKAVLDSVGDDVIVVLSRPFLVFPTTVIRDNDDDPIALGDLAAGDVVEVDARLDADGTLVALRIEREDDAPNRIELEAAVTAVGTTTLEVLGVSFLVDDATVITDDDDPATLADILPGQRVEVHALLEEGGVRRATRIEIERSGNVAGRVSTPASGTFGLPGLRVDYAADVLFVDEAGAAFDPAALTSGQAVRVSGTPGAQATLVASRVVVLGVQNPVASEGNAAPLGFEFDAVYPNPFAAQATVRYTLDRSAHVTLTVLDVRGREVRRLADASRAAGTHTETLDASGLSNGVYFVTLDVEGAGRVVRKTVLTR